jgi:hypothetical protein
MHRASDDADQGDEPRGGRGYMRIQLFAALHTFTVIGTAEISKDRFARTYVDGIRVAFVRTDGLFTTLHCVDGQPRYVMTKDWAAAQRLPTIDGRVSAQDAKH